MWVEDGKNKVGVSGPSWQSPNVAGLEMNGK